ncbi:MAG: hypothetical protein COV34_02630 [Candidatus Zambryskibacteria bacterium CG10_big_fil_rev_8_21_14_0_10_42_12]|uniref:Uncharacterized protein n=1 Tax=Candidatus Zambryskibacteria bacterium CG10_big_fil_rev_8_21_14_0_10_42_12 TaxID=1975115 RepID=A0A2H0QUK4_9BACT|nr:MAG: hypothetical protein COV34_02630 [Candidatus Zambryskibacteria bacterium CG10_big_fil_rev_8_21_14_0_10_42_12]
MKYLLYITLGFSLLLAPAVSSAQGNLNIGSAVKTETTTEGAVVFGYSIPEGSQLNLNISCNADAKFFLEETGAVVSCGESYAIPNPGEGGRLKIMPYDVESDTKVTYTLVREMDGETETVAEQVLDMKQTSPTPLFSQISVRQNDPTKARVTTEWKTLEKANISLTVGCDSNDLVLITPRGDRYNCNQTIELDTNSDSGKLELSVENHSTQEGLLFTFVAMRDGEVGALKNISFTFETTTEQVATGETDQSVINRLIAQVKALLQVVAGLFS